MNRTVQPQTVIPAQAGIQFVGLIEFRGNSWIPAFAGMTDLNDGLI
jgi:hypothetical protein